MPPRESTGANSAGTPEQHQKQSLFGEARRGAAERARQVGRGLKKIGHNGRNIIRRAIKGQRLYETLSGLLDQQTAQVVSEEDLFQLTEELNQIDKILKRELKKTLPNNTEIENCFNKMEEILKTYAILLTQEILRGIFVICRETLNGKSFVSLNHFLAFKFFNLFALSTTAYLTKSLDLGCTRELLPEKTAIIQKVNDQRERRSHDIRGRITEEYTLDFLDAALSAIPDTAENNPFNGALSSFQLSFLGIITFIGQASAAFSGECLRNWYNAAAVIINLGLYSIEDKLSFANLKESISEILAQENPDWHLYYTIQNVLFDIIQRTTIPDIRTGALSQLKLFVQKAREHSGEDEDFLRKNFRLLDGLYQIKHMTSPPISNEIIQSRLTDTLGTRDNPNLLHYVYFLNEKYSKKSMVSNYALQSTISYTREITGLAEVLSLISDDSGGRSLDSIDLQEWIKTISSSPRYYLKMCPFMRYPLVDSPVKITCKLPAEVEIDTTGVEIYVSKKYIRHLYDNEFLPFIPGTNYVITSVEIFEGVPQLESSADPTSKNRTSLDLTGPDWDALDSTLFIHGIHQTRRQVLAKRTMIKETIPKILRAQKAPILFYNLSRFFIDLVVLIKEDGDHLPQYLQEISEDDDDETTIRTKKITRCDPFLLLEQAFDFLDEKKVFSTEIISSLRGILPTEDLIENYGIQHTRERAKDHNVVFTPKTCDLHMSRSLESIPNPADSEAYKSIKLLCFYLITKLNIDCIAPLKLTGLSLSIDDMFDFIIYATKVSQNYPEGPCEIFRLYAYFLSSRPETEIIARYQRIPPNFRTTFCEEFSSKLLYSPDNYFAKLTECLGRNDGRWIALSRKIESLHNELILIPLANGERVKSQIRPSEWLNFTSIDASQHETAKISWVDDSGIRQERTILKTIIDDAENVANGNHRVLRITENYGTNFIKYEPEFPTYEKAVSLLAERVIGGGVPCVSPGFIEINNQKIPITISQGASGQELHEHFKDEASHDQSITYSTCDASNIERRISAASYTRQILLTLLVNPEDAKPDNILVDRKGNIISIDNERAFFPSIMLNPNSPAGRKMVTKSILYCFDLFTTENLDPDVIQEFLTLNPEEVARAWLQDFIEIQKAYTACFSSDEISKYRERESFIAPPLHEGITKTIYEKLVRMQQILRDTNEIKGMGLLKEIDPALAKIYQMAHSSSEGHTSAADRFHYITSDQYGFHDDGGPQQTMVQTMQLVETIPEFVAEDQILTQQISPEQAQANLDETIQQQEQIDLLASALKNKTFSADNQEQIQSVLNFIRESGNSQNLQKLLSALDFANINESDQIEFFEGLKNFRRGNILGRLKSHRPSFTSLKLKNICSGAVTQICNLLTESGNMGSFMLDGLDAASAERLVDEVTKQSSAVSKLRLLNINFSAADGSSKITLNFPCLRKLQVDDFDSLDHLDPQLPYLEMVFDRDGNKLTMIKAIQENHQDVIDFFIASGALTLTQDEIRAYREHINNQRAVVGQSKIIMRRKVQRYMAAFSVAYEKAIYLENNAPFPLLDIFNIVELLLNLHTEELFMETDKIYSNLTVGDVRQTIGNNRETYDSFIESITEVSDDDEPPSPTPPSDEDSTASQSPIPTMDFEQPRITRSFSTLTEDSLKEIEISDLNNQANTSGFFGDDLHAIDFSSLPSENEKTVLLRLHHYKLCLEKERGGDREYGSFWAQTFSPNGRRKADKLTAVKFLIDSLAEPNEDTILNNQMETLRNGRLRGIYAEYLIARINSEPAFSGDDPAGEVVEYRKTLIGRQDEYRTFFARPFRGRSRTEKLVAATKLINAIRNNEGWDGLESDPAFENGRLQTHYRKALAQQIYHNKPT